MSDYYQIAVNFPKKESILTYKSDFTLLSGDMVEVPLGRRKSQGIVLGQSTGDQIGALDKDKIKSVDSRVKGSLAVGENELELYKWMSKYYHYSLGKLIFDCLPKMMKRPKKIEFNLGKKKELPFSLNDEQIEVVTSISNDLKNGFNRHYIHGVTGSGKSIVFLQLIKEVIDSGKSAQFLLPEINLTPQFTNMFSEYLGVKVYSYHSAITPSEKYTIWKALKESDEPVLVMGVRSSIFLPIQNLGLVIVDEEHDSSFKQNDRCTYNARDIAVKKAQINNCTVLMGSATPSVENFFSFNDDDPSKKYYQLTKRAASSNFAKIEIVDTKIKNDKELAEDIWPLHPKSLEQIQERLDKGEQVIVFINKLGYSSYIQCRSCGYQFVNENCGCENNLRFFKAKNILSCSHCEYKVKKPDQCPHCGNLTLINKGYGTEKVQTLLSSLFPNNKIDRFDRDEIKNMKELTTKLDDFNAGKIDVLVGTQMIAKGHNFKNVNLVVMLGIDSMLNYADFRASEKAYALCEQVAGRSGRYSDTGKVIIQTMNPDHPIFEYVGSKNIEEFYKEEIKLRQFCYCPPFSKLAMIYFSSRFRDKLIGVISDVSRKLQSVSMEYFDSVKVYGPAPLMIEKKANQFTWAIMLKSDDLNQLHNLISSFEDNYQVISGINVKVDIDAQTTL
ncbi:MAG: primosomal protein N' [Bacteriovoracaceae bacterium]|jgi:primosomal protein N' (replication factor Y)|nr:primosomal protein N' [Bacteriovoracaceae bacterium]